MLDLLFAVIFIGAPIASIIILRSAALTAVLMAAFIGVSGVLMQATALTFTAFTYRQLQLWLAVTLLVLLAASFLLRGAKGPRLDRLTTALIVGSSVAVGLAFLASRALAPGSPGALSGVGYLIQRTDAEDNAKWLNAAAQLASGSPVDPRASVGGPLVLVLVVAATLVSIASLILYGGVNQVAVSADTLILSEMMLIILAPFALAPLVQMKRKWDEGTRSRSIAVGVLAAGNGHSGVRCRGAHELRTPHAAVHDSRSRTVGVHVHLRLPHRACTRADNGRGHLLR